MRRPFLNRVTFQENTGGKFNKSVVNTPRSEVRRINKPPDGRNPMSIDHLLKYLDFFLWLRVVLHVELSGGE